MRGKKIVVTSVFAHIAVLDSFVTFARAIEGRFKYLLDRLACGGVCQVELKCGVLHDGTAHLGIGREWDRIVRNDATCDNTAIGHAKYIVGFDGNVPFLAFTRLQVKTHSAGGTGRRLAVGYTVDITVIVQSGAPCVGAEGNFPNLAAVQRNGKQLGVAVIAVHDDVQRVVC